MSAMEDDTQALALQSDMELQPARWSPDAAGGSPESIRSAVSPSMPPEEQHGDAVEASPEHLSLHVDSQEMCCSQAMSSQGVDSTLAMMLDLGGRDTGEFESQGASAACPASENVEQAAPAPSVDEGEGEYGQADDAEKEDKKVEEVEEVANPEVIPRADIASEEHVEDAHDSQPSTCPGLEVLPQQVAHSCAEADATDAHMDDSFLEYLRRGQKERHPELEDDLFAEPEERSRHDTPSGLADASSASQPGSSHVGVSCREARPLEPDKCGSQDSLALERASPSNENVPEPTESPNENVLELTQVVQPVRTPVELRSFHDAQSADELSTVDAEDTVQQTRALLNQAVQIVMTAVYQYCNPDNLSEVSNIVNEYSDGAAAMHLLHAVIEKYVLRQFPEAPSEQRPLAEQAILYTEMIRALEQSVPDSYRLHSPHWPEAASCQDLSRAFKQNFVKIIEPCIAASGKWLSSAMGSHATSSSSGQPNAEDTYEKARVQKRAFARKFSELYKRQRRASFGHYGAAGAPAGVGFKSPDGAAGAPADPGAVGSRRTCNSDVGQAQGPSEAPRVDQKAHPRMQADKRLSVGSFLKGFL